MASGISSPGAQLPAGLSGRAAIDAYHQFKSTSASASALKYGAVGTMTADGRGPQGGFSATGSDRAVAGGSFAAIDADLEARARYLDDVYLSDEAQAQLAADQAADDGNDPLLARAADAARNGSTDLAGEIADLLGDLVALAKNGLTEVDQDTAGEDLTAAVRDTLVSSLSDRLTEAGLSEDGAAAVANHLADRIFAGTESGDSVIKLSLEEAVTVTAKARQSGNGTASAALEHLGGSVALQVSIDTASGKVQVLQSAAAVHQTRAGQTFAGAPPLVQGGPGRPPGDGPGPLDPELLDKLDQLGQGALTLDEDEETGDLIKRLLEAIAEPDDEDEDAEPRDGRFGITVPLPPLAVGADQDGNPSVYFPRPDETLGKVSLQPLEATI